MTPDFRQIVTIVPRPNIVFYISFNNIKRSDQKQHDADSDVGEDDAHPDLVGQRVEEREDARFGLRGFFDHDGDSQRHERFGEVDHLLSHQSDGQRSHGHIRLLSDKRQCIYCRVQT